MTFQEYTFTIKHRPGSLNQNADALSRHYHPMASTEQPGPNSILNCSVSLIPGINLLDAQRNDPDIFEIIEMKTHGFPNPLFLYGNIMILCAPSSIAGMSYMLATTSW